MSVQSENKSSKNYSNFDGIEDVNKRVNVNDLLTKMNEDKHI